MVWDKNCYKNKAIYNERLQENIVTAHTEVFDVTGESKHVTVEQISTLVGSRSFPISP